jgi:sec-independent protein translocase protein TatA
MGKIFESPIGVILILIVVLLIAAPKLPGMAKSLGQSMRVFRKELKNMNDEKEAEKGAEAKKDSKSDGDTDSTPDK